jgi:hypothetical protein
MDDGWELQDWISKFWQNCIGGMGDWLIESEVVKLAALTNKRCILAALYPDGWREGCGNHIRDMLARWRLARRESLP